MLYLFQAFGLWRVKHCSTVLGIRRLLGAPETAQSNAAIGRLVAEARREMWSYFNAKRDVMAGYAGGYQLSGFSVFPIEAYTLPKQGISKTGIS